MRHNQTSLLVANFEVVVFERVEDVDKFVCGSASVG